MNCIVLPQRFQSLPLSVLTPLEIHDLQEQNLICPICSEGIHTPVGCQSMKRHLFCAGCIGFWIQTHRNQLKLLISVSSPFLEAASVPHVIPDQRQLQIRFRNGRLECILTNCIVPHDELILLFSCPLCREEHVSMTGMTMYHSLLNDRQVKCHHSDCDWIGNWKDMNDHEKQIHQELIDEFVIHPVTTPALPIPQYSQLPAALVAGAQAALAVLQDVPIDDESGSSESASDSDSDYFPSSESELDE